MAVIVINTRMGYLIIMSHTCEHSGLDNSTCEI